ncbi:uncharacterized protein [Periplaneta americana]|uniref:uncharacterized protein isoform X2 n=1 Tax=Periplaneta americana TaxID=6978 RepID=UPI0037E759BA
MDVIKMEPDINALHMQTSDAEEKSLSEEGNILDLHVTEIKTEYKDHSYDLISEMTVDKTSVPVDFPVMKSEVEEENVLDLHMSEIKTECMVKSYDLKSEITFEETPVPVCFSIMNSEAKEETHELDQVEEEVKLEVTAEEDEVFTEGMFVVLLAVVCFMGGAQSCDLKTYKPEDLIPERLVGAWYMFYALPMDYSNAFSCYNTSYTLTSKNQLYVKNSYYDNRHQTIIKYNSEVTVKKNVLEWKGERSEWDSNYIVFATDYDNFIVIGGCSPGFSSSPLYGVAFRKQSLYSDEQLAAEDALRTYNLSLRDFARTC